MSASNRQALITKTYKVLKKHYHPVAPPADRSVLEHLLYACCLENGKHEQVDEVFARLEQNYFDWNEVRVTTLAELAEVMAPLPDASDAARRLKRALHSVFESHYSFDLEFLKKQNLGKAIEHLEKFNGVTPFGVAYVTQNALGGHAIPVNQGVFQFLQLVGILTEAEAAKQRVPGMERAIPKTKGVEFGSLLHQLGVDFAASPNAARVRTVVLEIAPDAKDRLPRRPGTKKDGEPRENEPESKPSSAPPDSRTEAGSQPTVASKDVPKTGDETDASRRPAAANGGGESAAKSASKRLSRKKPR